MVNQLNKLVAQKKKRTEELQTKADLAARAAGARARATGTAVRPAEVETSQRR